MLIRRICRYLLPHCILPKQDLTVWRNVFSTVQISIKYVYINGVTVFKVSSFPEQWQHPSCSRRNVHDHVFFVGAIGSMMKPVRSLLVWKWSAWYWDISFKSSSELQWSSLWFALGFFSSVCLWNISWREAFKNLFCKTAENRQYWTFFLSFLLLPCLV